MCALKDFSKEQAGVGLDTHHVCPQHSGETATRVDSHCGTLGLKEQVVYLSSSQLMSVTQLCFDDFTPERMKHGKKERLALAPFESMQDLLRQQLGRSKAFQKMVVATESPCMRLEPQLIVSQRYPYSGQGHGLLKNIYLLCTTSGHLVAAVRAHFFT